MKTVLRQSNQSKVYGGRVKTTFAGRLKSVLRGSPPEGSSLDNARLLEDSDFRLLEDGSFRLLE